MLDKILIGATGFMLGRSTGSEEEDNKTKINLLKSNVTCLTQELYLLEELKELFIMYVDGNFTQKEIEEKISHQISQTKIQLKRIENQLNKNKQQE